jgi:hypothetical protein
VAPPAADGDDPTAAASEAGPGTAPETSVPPPRDGAFR